MLVISGTSNTNFCQRCIIMTISRIINFLNWLIETIKNECNKIDKVPNVTVKLPLCEG